MTSPAPSTPSPTRLTARTPEDLLAVVPLVLGFQVTDSLVLLTFGGRRPFHARIDLPGSAAEDADVVAALLDPARRHGVRAVALVALGAEDRAAIAGRIGRRVVGAFQRAGIDVVDALRADGHRWHPLLPGRRPGVPTDGVPYDLSCHPFTAQAVFDGRAVLGSREELAAGLEPDRDAVAAVAALLAGADPAGPDDVAALVAAHLADGRIPDAALPGLLLGLRDPATRDAAWATVRRPGAHDHVRLWTDTVRRAPAAVRGGPAAVLALTAWAAGDGALAWCAIDRCREVDPRNSLAQLVADALDRALPPSMFEDGASLAPPR
ncbi:MAG TPA: DUF4192 domain-containing protein [Nocardioides sp.]|uniref:DUF4192 domain-containing protein n=1 Tax=Nocardioides sp. TaxID=35761 RepID=UPI002C8FE52D|nr:DUF4192 domain-containing protein [Nocardioides sp.]HTW15153.1 DUF4192 domain-containing protein [Nocardioides sp.]